MLFTNYVAIIIILGLCILPSLYAWFNIKACWDPYGNTKGIKVAVVNKDSGYKFDNMDLKLGEEIVSELKKIMILDGFLQIKRMQIMGLIMANTMQVL